MRIFPPMPLIPTPRRKKAPTETLSLRQMRRKKKRTRSPRRRRRPKRIRPMET